MGGLDDGGRGYTVLQMLDAHRNAVEPGLAICSRCPSRGTEVSVTLLPTQTEPQTEPLTPRRRAASKSPPLVSASDAVSARVAATRTPPRPSPTVKGPGRPLANRRAPSVSPVCLVANPRSESSSLCRLPSEMSTRLRSLGRFVVTSFFSGSHQSEAMSRRV